MRKGLFIFLGLAATTSLSFGPGASVARAMANSPGAALAANALHNDEGPEDLTAWREALTQRLEQQQRWDEAGLIKRATLPPGWALERAGDLGIALETGLQGARIWSLYDLRCNQEFLAPSQPPLFRLILRQAATKAERDLPSDRGWGKTTFRARHGGFVLQWERPLAPELQGIKVVATARLDQPRHALGWQLEVRNRNASWAVWRCAFPGLALADLGPGASVFFPRGPGEVQTNVWARQFRYEGQYPGGWCSMQFMAAYQDAALSGHPTGLYYALHDPWGSPKSLLLESDATNRTVWLATDHPAPNMGLAPNSFSLSGQAVWQLLRGDWFDAARMYKQWAREHARWWPVLDAAGRSDTPPWMRQLCAWAMSGGSSTDCVSRVLQFQRSLGVPVGFHWYNWHQIPFDNDYPHYFPAKPGFAARVQTLQLSNVFVMPYINGRLWDTHDRGAEDFEFTRLALPAATKRPDGQPFVESYGSKETNGSPVRLAVMCPTMPLWQRTIRETVLGLLRGVGTRSVYIDQVAAAPPALCMDPTHGHPLGGGHWWNEGYWGMLSRIRRAMPPSCMLTTECNGEPFIRWFDGYLTWHWQYDGQVPAFPAVYGGAIQMFGRAYRGGPTKEQALWMKAGQQLVFGEQIGWLDPEMLKDATNADFFRQTVRLRHQFQDYFCLGEMARPPKLGGNIPKITADWQWSKQWPVTTDAVLTGAWEMPKKRRLLLLFVNVSNLPIRATVGFKPGQYGLPNAKLVGRVYHGADVAGVDMPLPFNQETLFSPRQVQAWEYRW